MIMKVNTVFLTLLYIKIQKGAQMEDLTIYKLSSVNLQTCLGIDTYLVGLLTDVEIAQTKAKVDYAKLTIIDKDQTFVANIWDLSLVHIDTIKSSLGQIVKLTGKAKTFGNGVSFAVYAVAILTDEDLLNSGLTREEFYNVVANRQELANTLNQMLASIEHTHYGKIATLVIKQNWDIFKSVAAGKSVHHAAVGGLLLHTVEVMKIADHFYNMSKELGYNNLCRPLMIAGAAIHDIGKCQEITTAPVGSSEYTTDSILETHHISGMSIVVEAATMLGLQNTRECKELKHIIAAHHEKQEWGQLKAPVLIEAELISKADYLSAALNATDRALKQTKPGDSYQAFGYNHNWVKSMGEFNNDKII